MKFAFVMSEEVGLRTQYLNWRKSFPVGIGIEPHWITVSFEKKGGWIESLPGLPNFVKTRIRAALEIREGLRSGPFDATFIAVHSALTMFPGYAARHDCFTTLDVTPKQLHEFGDFYGKYPSKFAVVEAYKHRARVNNYLSYRGLFPWSHWAAESLRLDYRVDAKRIHVVPPGVDTTVWSPTAIRPMDGPVRLLFVGGDFDRKGGRLLLEWAEKTTAQNWTLNVVTRQKLHITDERIAVHNHLTSNDPALTDLYRTSHVFVLPTQADCYSIAGMEALASGLPVVISLTGGTGDVIKDGVTGYLLKEPNVKDLDDKLAPLIVSAQLRSAMSDAARKDAVSRYDVVKNIRQTVDFMIEAL